LPHGFCRRGKEMSPVLPLAVLLPDQFQPGFMNESGGLKSLVGVLAGHFVRRQAAQLRVNQWQESLGGLAFAVLDRIKDAGHVAHFVKSS
jgi:hypothetical protein